VASTHYTRSDLAEALNAVGVRAGDTIFSHSNIGFFGIPETATNSDEACALILEAVMDVLGDQGTLVVPTFTYSFPDGLIFDPDHTPSRCGAFTEYVRLHPQAQRSHDPCVSVAAIGALADKLTTDVPVNAYGSESFAARFFDANGRICNFNLDAGSTLIHFVERELEVPYRFDKEFQGVRRIDGEYHDTVSILWVRRLVDGTEADFTFFDLLARQRRLFHTAPVGRGQVGSITAASTRDLIGLILSEHPRFLTRAGLTGKMSALMIEVASK